jgi:hypothetical protein
MPRVPNSFDFVQGRPCVQIQADGLPSDKPLVCLFDPLSDEYELLLYPNIPGLAFQSYVAIEAITLLDGSSRVSEIGLLGVTWIHGRKHAQTKILHRPARRIPDIHGFVGLSFFADQRLDIECRFDPHQIIMTGSVTVLSI